MKQLQVCALIVFAAVNASAQIGQGINFYSVEREIALGRGLAQEYERQATLLDNAAVREYISELGARLTARLPPDAIPLPYIFKVVTGDNAFNSRVAHEPNALPGGFVYVPASLIATARDEAELAGMLAHSIAHVAARHGTRQDTRGQIAESANLPLIFTAGNALRQEEQLSVPLRFLMFSRQFELEADRIAVSVLAASGHDPNALVRYLERDGSVPPARLASLRAQIAQPAPRFTEIQDLLRQQ